MPVRSRFKEGEIVLAYQGCLIYEAKVLGVSKETSGFIYDIHYKGWNKTWDEQVAEDRLLKLTADNLAKQKAAEVELKSKKSNCSHSNSKKNGSGGNCTDIPTQEGTEANPIEIQDKSNIVPTEIKITKKPPVKEDIAPIVSKKSNENKSQSSVKVPKKDVNKSKVSSKVGKRSRYESVEVRLEVIPKAKKIRSRSNSNASIISINSSNSTDMIKATKTRPIKPKISKLESDVSLQKKKKSKKKSLSKDTAPSPKKSGKSQAAVIQTRKQPFGSEINFDLPPELKIILVDDLDYIGRQRKLTSIPSRFNVNDVVNEYYDDLKIKTDVSSEELASAEEVCKGLRDYFNSTLGSLLLYKFERVQYADTLKEYPGAVMSQLYGPVHLLRLLTKLGPMLSNLPSQQSEIDKIVRHINRFITFIASKRSEMFKIEDYGTATPEYHRRAL